MNHKDANGNESVFEIYEWIADEANNEGIDAEGKVTVSQDLEFSVLTDALRQIEEFVHKVLDCDDMGFIVEEINQEKNKVTVTKSRVYKLPLSQYFHRVIDLFQYYSPHFEYSLHVDLFFKSCFALALGNDHFKEPLGGTSKAGKRAFELFNDLISLIRSEGRDSEFKAQLHHRTYNAKRNYASALKFVTGLFKKRLLVLRVDFAYQSKFASSISAEQMQADFAHFRYNFRRNQALSKHLQGYVWKIEYGYKKGHHVHCLFFYDGSKVQNDSYWAKEIGRYWAETITNGKGMFYNGNSKENKAKYEQKGLLGIGMIGRIRGVSEPDPDKTMRDILLNKILVYFLKAEQFLIAKSVNSPQGRTFGKGRG